MTLSSSHTNDTNFTRQYSVKDALCVSMGTGKLTSASCDRGVESRTFGDMHLYDFLSSSGMDTDCVE